jgi:hypothetical protein
MRMRNTNIDNVTNTVLLQIDVEWDCARLLEATGKGVTCAGTETDDD